MAADDGSTSSILAARWRRACVTLSAVALASSLAIGWTGFACVFDSDRVVRTDLVRSVGIKLRWDGEWARRVDRCDFLPDYPAWERRARSIGIGLTTLGVAMAAVTTVGWLGFRSKAAAIASDPLPK